MTTFSRDQSTFDEEYKSSPQGSVQQPAVPEWQILEQQSCMGLKSNPTENSRTVDIHGANMYQLPITQMPVTYAQQTSHGEGSGDPQSYSESVNPDLTDPWATSERLSHGFIPDRPHHASHETQAVSVVAECNRQQEEENSAQHPCGVPWNAMSSAGTASHQIPSGILPDCHRLPSDAGQSSVTGDQSWAEVAHGDHAAILSPEGIEPPSLVNLGTSNPINWTSPQVPINGDNFDLWATIAPGLNPASVLYEIGFGEQYLPWSNMEEASLITSNYGSQPSQLVPTPTTGQISHMGSGVVEDVLDQPLQPTATLAGQSDSNANAVSHSPNVESAVPTPPRQKRRVDLALFQQDSVNSEQCTTCRKYFPRRAMREHMRTHDATMRSYRCNHPGCNKAFYNQRDLARHESIH